MSLPEGFVLDESREPENIAGIDYLPVKMSLRNNFIAYFTDGIVGNHLVRGYQNPLTLMYSNYLNK